MRHFLFLLILGCLLPCVSEAAVVNRSVNDRVRAGLLAQWSFDGGDLISNVTDRSGSANHGYLSNFAATSTIVKPGKIGQAIMFDGVGDNVRANSDFIGTSAATISMWIYPRSFGQETIGALISNGRTLMVFSGAASQIRFRSDGSTDASISFTSASHNKWTHLVVTRNASGTTNFFVNGVSTGTLNQSSGAPAAGTTNVILGNNNAANTTFDGMMDDVRIYSRVLADTEIKALYNLGNLALAANTSLNTSITNGLVGLWTLDGKDLIANVKDVSRNANTGYFANITSTSTAVTFGKLGQALKFDGADDYIQTSADTLGTTDVTVVGWIKQSAFPSIGQIVSNGNTILRTVGVDKRLEFSSNNFTTTAHSGNNSTATLDKWYHVAAVRNSSNQVTFYIDGAVAGTQNQAGGTPSAGTFNMRIGAGTNGVFPFAGAMDDIRVYNRALTAVEIKKLYTTGAVPVTQNASRNDRSTTGLVGLWSFDGKDLLTNVFDSSRNGNTGSMINFTSTSTAVTIGKIGQGLRFDGVNDYITVGTQSSLNLTGEMTAMAWVKTNTIASGATIIAGSINSGGNLFYWSFELNRTAARVGFVHGDSGVGLMNVTNNTNLAANRWYHVAVVRTGSSGNWTTTFYVDGIADGAPTSSNDPASQQTTSIGRGGALDLRYFNGTIDDLRVYNRALTATEISQIHNMGK